MTFNRFIRWILYSLLGPVTYQKVIMRRQLGYWPDIYVPRTFNECLANRMLFNPPPNAAKAADKLAVRDYVASKLSPELLTPLLYSSPDARSIPWDRLPKSFVIKCSHNSGTTYIINDKDTANRNAIEDELAAALANRFVGKYTNEQWYMQIEPKLLIEELMVDKTHGIPLDYKFFVFNGRVEFIQVDYARFTKHTRSFYSRTWELQPFTLKYPPAPAMAKPKRLNDMIAIAEKLANDMPFVRVDLYLLNDTEIRFGEITFAPEAALGRFTPASTDQALGQLWMKSAKA